MTRQHAIQRHIPTTRFCGDCTENEIKANKEKRGASGILNEVGQKKVELSSAKENI